VATESDILTVRGFVNEPDDSNGWTTERIGALIDANAEDLRATASDIWTAKASATTFLVDVSENGSSRKLSDIHKNYLAMARQFRSESVDLLAAQSIRPTTRPIVRP
jgi:hypothetical protein